LPLPLLALCYGTRPQIIKVSLLIEALGERFDVITVETGQHYDLPLNAELHGQLHVRTPDHALEAGDAPAGDVIETICRRAAQALALRRPDAVIVIGDTNSTAGSARAACELGIPLVHVEAGLRMNGPPTAEELIRREVDRVSDLLCAPSAHAVQNLAAEHVHGTVVLTGDIAYDVLLRNLEQLGPAEVPLPPGTPFVLATLHRAELVEDGPLLKSVFGALRGLELPVILLVHPRLRAALLREGLADASGEHLSPVAYRLSPASSPPIHLLSPLGYLETIAAVREAAVVITDSGGLQREAYWLGKPCVTLRNETEWVETVACGANILVAPDRAAAELHRAVLQSLNPPIPQSPNPPISDPPNRSAYGTGNAGQRIADAIHDLLS
jgi:UDP-GlcNAc3NAcA epimerase